MNTLNTLHDAFAGLEERADAALTPASDHTVSVAPSRRGLIRFAAPAAAAAAVAAVATGVVVWQHSGGDGRPAQQPVAGSGTTSTAPSSAPKPKPHRYTPPATSAELAAETRAILAGTATIQIDPTRSSDCGSVRVSVPAATGKVTARLPNGATPTVPIPQANDPESGCSGAAIGGSLTSSGRTGGFDLDVFAAAPSDKASCDGDTSCSVHHRPDGSTLAIGTWHDSNLPGGITYQVELVRPDGAEILIHLSTMRDPKGAGPVTASRVPLTIDQLTAFVTSDRW